MHHAESKVFLHPGEFYFKDDTAHVHTILGSCIAITLWHPKLHIGGMCHFTLPRHPHKDKVKTELDGRYADDVMQMFKLSAQKFGTDISEYDAKIFGGGNMMRKEGQCLENSIGTKNSAIAMELLMAEGVAIQVAHVGEFGHRRIVFDVYTGDVWVRHTEDGGVRLNHSLNGKS